MSGGARTQREREEEQLEKDLDEGRISDREYREELRAMNAADRAYAEECAERAYQDAMGGGW